MADPLSLTASILAVVGAAEGVMKTLARIRDLRNAPEEVLALINEVSDLRLILGDIESYIQNNTRSPAVQDALQHLFILINRAKDNLLQLDELIQYRLTKPESVLDQIKISRREWTRAKTTIDRFRQGLRDIRLNIVSQMVVINSSYQSRIGLMIDEIYIISNNLQSKQSQAESRNAQHLNENSMLLRNLLSNQSGLRSLLQTQRQPDRSDQVLAPDVVPPQVGSSSNNVIYVKASRYQRPSCKSYCKCACHIKHVFQTPTLLEKMIGSLFIGYSGHYLRMGTLQRCTEARCRSQNTSQTYVNYLFPSWFLAKAIVFELTTKSLGEISVSLTIQRIIPNGSEVFRLASLNDVKGLQQLFSKGLASPNDSRQNGASVLWGAVKQYKLQTIEFLLQAGADPWIENLSTHQSPYDTAWDTIFRAPETRSTEESLRRLFPPNYDHLDRRSFSMLHKIVLGIYCLDLEEQLALLGKEVDTIDSEGKTPLIWAASRGDSRAVQHLLKARADPNLLSYGGLTALSAASQSGSVKCIRLILAAGANVQLVSSSWGNNALHYSARYQNSGEIIRVLAAAGIDCNKYNIEGELPLIVAAIYHRDVAAAALLDCGANVNGADPDGDTALLNSIYYGSNKVTKQLLSRGATYTSWLSTGDSILHLAAKSGDNATIEIMLAARLHGIDPDAVNRGGKTVLQLAQERESTDEGFVEKLQDLLADIRARNATYESTFPRDTDSDEKSTWLRRLWIIKPAQGRCVQKISHTRFATSIWTHWLFGLCIVGFVCIYRSLEPGAVSSLVTMIWDMVDPGDFEG